MKESDNYVLIGRVNKPHGIKGELKITPFSDDPDKLAGYKTLFLTSAGKSGHLQKHHLLKVRNQVNYAVISLSGINSRDKAEELKGSSIWVARDELPLLSESEYYWYDFMGRDVFTRQGKYLGKVSNLISNGPHDVLVISEARGREYMIPVCDDFVEDPDKEKDRIIVSPPEGLLDINE